MTGSAASPTAELEESDKRHKDARRLARLLVSEIKLYNENAVTQGRANKDLYMRLKKDIDRSLDVYHQRVPDEIRAQFDYLYDELLRQLGDGDAANLGKDCPEPNPPRSAGTCLFRDRGAVDEIAVGRARASAPRPRATRGLSAARADRVAGARLRGRNRTAPRSRYLSHPRCDRSAVGALTPAVPRVTRGLVALARA